MSRTRFAVALLEAVSRSAAACGDDDDAGDQAAPADAGEGAPIEGSEALVKHMPGEDGAQPLVLLAEHPTGASVKPHKHQNGRLEYVIDREIEFFEGPDALAMWRGEPVEGTRHGPGSVSSVPGGTLYDHRITKASRLLHVHQSHGGNETVHCDLRRR